MSKAIRESLLPILGLAVLAPLQPVNAATLNAISISYIPVIQQSNQSPDNWMLDTRQRREALGLDPSGAAINDFYGEYNFSLSQIRERVSQIQNGAKNALEEGSRYHGYKNSSAEKSIEYNFLNSIEILEGVPLSDRSYNGNPLPDYMSMMNRQNICNYVDNQDVKEVWLYSYGGIGKGGWESNFSSKYGDISNSDRYPYDLPQCQKSYTVYDYNYGRYVAEAVHNHMHQFESIFGDIDYSLFWNKFTSSCGNTHFPPNGQQDYDYHNPNPVLSDCEDWHPYGTGKQTSISNATWNDDEVNYYIYWMQNIPGANNGLTDCSPQDSNCVPTKRLKNWWTFINDFDKAYTDKTFWETIPPDDSKSVPEPSTIPFISAAAAALLAFRKRLSAKR